MQFATLLIFTSVAAAAAVGIIKHFSVRDETNQFVDGNIKAREHDAPELVQRSPCWWDGQYWHDCAK